MLYATLQRMQQREHTDASYFNFNTASSFQSKESYDSLLLRVISFNDKIGE